MCDFVGIYNEIHVISYNEKKTNFLTNLHDFPSHENLIKWRNVKWRSLIKTSTPPTLLCLVCHVCPHQANKKHDVHSTFPSSDRFCVYFQSAGSKVTYTHTQCVCRHDETPVGAGAWWKGPGWAALPLRNWSLQRMNKTYAQVFSWKHTHKEQEHRIRQTYRINETHFTVHRINLLENSALEWMGELWS